MFSSQLMVLKWKSFLMVYWARLIIEFITYRLNNRFVNWQSQDFSEACLICHCVGARVYSLGSKAWNLPLSSSTASSNGKLHFSLPHMLSLLDMQLYFYLLLHVTGIALNCISSCHLSSLSSLLIECNICHWKHGTRNFDARCALFKQLAETGGKNSQCSLKPWSYLISEYIQ